jgi:hypothetical protein
MVQPRITAPHAVTGPADVHDDGRDNLPHLQRLAAYSRKALEELEAVLPG